MSRGPRFDDDIRRAPVRADVGRLGMRLFLAALSMLFAASIVGYVLVRMQAKDWPPPGMPAVPSGLWLSTALIVASSFTMIWALRGARSGNQRALRLGLALTALLGFGFLISQTVSWFALVTARLTARTNLYGFTFFMLTGLHAAHVIGGLAPLLVATRRAFAGRYGPDHHAGVEYVSMYWHFLDVVWLVLFAVLRFTG